MLRNKVAELFDITYPIIQAPMAGGITTPELVSAVSNNGGLGMIGAGYMSPEKLRTCIHEVRQKTENNFGVNVFVPSEFHVTEETIDTSKKSLESIYKTLSIDVNMLLEIPTSKCTYQKYEKQLEVIIEEDVPICSFTFGVPSKETIKKLKDNGIILVGTATTVREAILIEKLEMDVVVAQGYEAGGHRGSFLNRSEDGAIGTMSLVPQIADAVDLPVVAAGGIMDSRGLRAAMFLGAKAVQMGTAFLTCQESGANELHKKAILNAEEDETTLTRSFSGKMARGLKNQFIREMKEKEKELPDYPIQNYLTNPIRKVANEQQKKEYMSLWSGQSPRLAKNQTVGELIHQIMEGVF